MSIDVTIAERDALIREVERLQREMAVLKHYDDPCKKIFEHKWLDSDCVERGCQSLVLLHRQEVSNELADTLRRVGEEMAKALTAAQPRLQDWIRTTGFGESNRKDRAALALTDAAITAWSKLESK